MAYGRKTILSDDAYPSTCVYCGHGYDECDCNFNSNTMAGKESEEFVDKPQNEPCEEPDINKKIVEKIKELLVLIGQA